MVIFLSVLCMRALELARQLSCVLLTYSKPRITSNTQELKPGESRFLNNIIVSLIWHTLVWIAFSCPYYVSRSRTQLKGSCLCKNHTYSLSKTPRKSLLDSFVQTLKLSETKCTISVVFSLRKPGHKHSWSLIYMNKLGNFAKIGEMSLFLCTLSHR